MKNLLLIFSVLLSTSLSAVEYGILSLHNDYDNYIVLEEGDILEVLSTHSEVSSSTGAKLLGVFYSTDNSLLEKSLHGGNKWNSISSNLLYREDLNYGDSGEGHRLKRTLVGPMKVFITSSHHSFLPASLSYKLSRASEVEYKNVNIISLPSSSVGQGTHEIVVEASDDLQSWTPVHSSSIGGNKAFFRTRVVEAE